MKTLSAIRLIQIVVLVEVVSACSVSVHRTQFTNDSFTGYISENLNQQQEPASNVDLSGDWDKWRRNVVSPLSSSTRPVVYVRFVDKIKPSILVTVDLTDVCSCVTHDRLNLGLTSADYDQESAVELFQIDLESMICSRGGRIGECLCYFHLRVSDDPMTRDRLNREAKESFKFQMSALNSTTTINIQVLDDNDLEPMFDPTEYSIVLDKYTVSNDGGIVRSQQPEFAPIGRVFASDPDMGSNALTRFFLSEPHPFFSIDWLTGHVYLKRSLRHTFDALANHSQIVLEAKTIDNGLKYSTINALTRLNQNVTLTDFGITSAASQLNLNSTTLKQLPKFSPFESAQIQIQLNSNLPQIYEQVFSTAELTDLVDRYPTLNNRIPFKILKIVFKKDRYVNIDRTNLKTSHFIDLIQIDSSSFLVSFDPNLNVSQSVRIEFCVDPHDLCHLLVEFGFNSSLAVAESLERTCSVGFDPDSRHELTITRFSCMQNLWRLRSRIEPAYCRRLLNIFFSSNDSSLSIDDKTGLVSLSGEASFSTGSYLIYPVYYYQNRRLNIIRTSNFILDVKYSKRFDHLYNVLVSQTPNEPQTDEEPQSSQVDLIRSTVDLNRTSLLFESNSQTRIVKILYCSVDRHGSADSCPFYVNSNRLESIHGARFSSANVLLKLNENASNFSRYVNLLVSNSETTPIVRVRSEVEAYPILVARPLEAMGRGEFGLTQNEREPPCFSVNRTNGWIMMNCWDDESIDNLLTVSLKQPESTLTANIRIEIGTEPFAVTEYSFTESILDASRVDELIRNEDQLSMDSIRSYFRELYPGVDTDSSVSLVFYNATHISLEWVLDSNSPTPSTPIYRLDPNYVLNSRSMFLFESMESTYLRLDNSLDGVIYLAAEIEIPWKRIDEPVRLEAQLNLLEASPTHISRHQIQLQVNVILGNGMVAPRPILSSNEFDVEIDRDRIERNQDFEVIQGGFQWADDTGLFDAEFELKTDYPDYDFPFFVRQSRLYFANSGNKNLKSVYKFKILVDFKKRNSENNRSQEEIQVTARLLNFGQSSRIRDNSNTNSLDSRVQVVAHVDLSVDITSASLYAYLKCPLIGFVSKKTSNGPYKLIIPELPKKSKSRKNTASLKTQELEQKLLIDNFLRYLAVDEQTGALYLNMSEQSGLWLYSKWSKLRKYFWFERNLTSKLVKIEVQSDTRFSVYVELVLLKRFDVSATTALSQINNHRNRFLVNSNNLLSMFRHGDEFVLSMSVEENSMTWVEPIVSIREYLRASVMRNRKSTLQFEMVKDSLAYYLLHPDDSYFSLEGNNSLLLTKPNIQFDYERQNSYHLKILIVQPYEPENQNANQDTDDLVFSGTDHDKFYYFLDVNIAVRNQIDEPFVCSQPVYSVFVDENESKSRPIFTVPITDFDSQSAADDRFAVQFVGGNSQSLFSSAGLTIYTTGRKLDREVREHHALDLKVIDRAANSTRFALCRLNVFVNDSNDNRPIVNDIELSLYDRLDRIDIPVANAIAIDQDSIAKLTYSIISVRDLEDGVTNLDPIFVMNSTTGSLFATQSQLPCFECTIQIVYKATDVGQGKTRVSRKSAIKLHVRKFPSSLMRINPQTSSTELLESAGKTFQVEEKSAYVRLSLDEDTKLGEKLYQIRVDSKLLNSADSIVYFTLLEGSNLNSTFYLSNHDGSLYLIKKLAAPQVFNLTVLVTNWLGQIEYVPVEINVKDVNDNAPEFESGPCVNVTAEISVDTMTGFKVIALGRVRDRDEMDHEQLRINVEDCFYISRDILIKKPMIQSIGVSPTTNHIHFPMCSSKSIRLNVDSSGMLTATISIDEMVNFLRNSTDYYVPVGGRGRDPVIDFYLDLAVRDSLETHQSVARVRLELVLKQARSGKLVFKRDVGSHVGSKPTTYGFKQPLYKIEIPDLSPRVELIRLVNEFVWIDSDSNPHSFRPHELQFYATKGANRVQIEPNFGLVYLNETESNLFEVEIGCRVMRKLGPSVASLDLHPKTRLVVSVRPLEADLASIISRRIWTGDEIHARLPENSPVGSFITLESEPSQLLFAETIDLIPKNYYSVVFSSNNPDLFEVEETTGRIRSKFEADFEANKSYSFNLRVCAASVDQSVCFKHELTVVVNISNRNDNEPRFSVGKNKSTLSLISPGEIVRAMTLFRFNALDVDSDPLSFELIDAKLSNSSVLEWFELFDTARSRGVRLSDQGYDQITKKSQSGRIELVVEASDGLFANRHIFILKITHLDSKSILSNPLAPIILNLDVVENSHNIDAPLVPSFHQTLSEYLNVEPDSYVVDFELTNYELEFEIDPVGSLWLRSGHLDRESRDIYELFIRVRMLFSRHVEHVPTQFRVLVKVTDLNDNCPEFVGLQHMDKTIMWTDFVQSSRVRPILTVKATDEDLNDKLTYYLDPSNTPLDIFQMDERSGSLYLSEAPLDLDSIWNEHSSTSNLITHVGVSVYDEASHKTTRTINLHFVRFVDPDQVIRFDQTRYNFQVVESVAANQTIGFVNSARLITNQSSHLIYEIVDGDDSYDDFRLDYLTGRLYSSGNLDYEQKSNYTLVIRARPTIGLSHSNTTVVVSLIDCNDNAPRFPQFEYNTSVVEGLPPMSQVYQLTATDADSPNSPHTQIRYKLLNQLDLFYIHEKTGWVYNKQLLDASEYMLKIQAYDVGSVYVDEKWKAKSLSSVAHLIVRVQDTNNQKPVFEKSLYTAHVELVASESSQFVTKVSAKDDDHAHNRPSPLTYSILYQPWPFDLFTIDPQTGVIRLNVARFQLFADVSPTTVFNLVVAVNDSVFSQTTRVNIQIKSVGASPVRPPRFHTDLVHLTFGPDDNSTDLFEYLMSRRETPDDENLEFSVSSDGPFSVHKKRFLTMSTLNSPHLYQIPVMVCTRAPSTLCDQTVFVVNVTGGEKNETEADNRMLTLDAHAKNVGFAYNYGAYTIQQFFQGPLLEPNDYDYQNEDVFESNERFYFEFKTVEQRNTDELSDSKLPYKLEFDLNQCVFAQLNTTLSNSTLAKQIRHFTHSKSHWSLSRQQIKSLFSLNRHNGVLSSRKIINSMLPGVYLFTISLRLVNRSNSSVDADRTHFKLTVLPPASSISNNQTANFYKFDREFYKFKSSAIGRIQLSNRLKPMNNSNHKIRYQLIENKFSWKQKMIKLDERTGELSMNSSGMSPDLDDNELVVYALATVDLGPARRNSSLLNRLEYMCEIYIDFSDSPTSLASPPSPPQPHQPIDSEIRLAPSLVRLKLDETIDRDFNLFRFVSVLGSADDRRGLVKYEIVSPDVSFEIDSKTGWLRLSRELIADESRITFNVSGCLETHCGYSRVEVEIIDINNNPPRFEQRTQEASIREDSLPGTVVATVYARDVDSHSKLEYFIIDGDPLDQFAISPDGKVYTRLMIDRESKPQYDLDIAVVDGKFRDEMRLRVVVADVSDQRPVCVPSAGVRLDLHENVPVGSLIYSVSVHNLETNVTRLKYEIIGHEQVETGADNLIESYPDQIPFRVDEINGQVRVSDQLDYEHQRSYEFFVRVVKTDLDSDLSSSRSSPLLLPWTQYCLIKFEISVIDINDNSPQFGISNRRVIELVEGSPRGTVLGQITTHDADSKINSVVRYELAEAHARLLFTIDPKMGVIQLNAAELDREQTDWVNFTVRAFNLVDRLAAEFEVRVDVVDLNDNAPKFDRSEYFISVEENLASGVLITQLVAVDPDVNSTTEYSIVGDDGDSKFVLEKDTGKLFLNGSLDYEQKQQYLLTISAKDPLLSSGTSTARLVIDILDLNDNTPQFDPSTPSHFYVNENTPINTTIYHVTAYDLDKSAVNSALTYRIASGAENGWIGLDPETGRLYTAAVVDFERLANPNISLTIECSDHGKPERRKSQLTITVIVLDVNDCPPEFERPNQTIIFKESFPIGQEITKFKVFDRDGTQANRGPFSFELISDGRGDSGFAVRKNGSLYLTRRPLRNITHVVRVRCHDSGSPYSLSSDSHLTIKITDESSNEPHVLDQTIEITTLEAWASVQPDVIIGQVRAWDLDKQDVLSYEVEESRPAETIDASKTGLITVERQTGLIKSTRSIHKSANIHLKSIVTDSKFITEANLDMIVRSVNHQCLSNSLFAKFVIRSNSSFVSLGYLRRFREVVGRVMSSQLRSSSVNLSRYEVIVAGLRYEEIDSNSLDGLDLEPEHEDEIADPPVITEVLFSIAKSGSSQCLNSKQVVKLLNKRKSIVMKRMKTSVDSRLKLVDLSFSHECASGSLEAPRICTTNMALQQCRLRLGGDFNSPFESCENLTQGSLYCYMIPKYEWDCGGSPDETSMGEVAVTTSLPSKSHQLCKPQHNPCKNNAICRQLKVQSIKNTTTGGGTKLRVQCHCPIGFRGKLCEEDIDECAGASEAEQPPCSPTATCINTYGSYICNCTLEPSTLCYNTLSSKFSPSVLELKHVQKAPASKSHSEINSVSDRDGDQDEEIPPAQLTLLGYSVPVVVVQQALLGIFGGICALLIVLSMAAAIVCRVNMSKRRHRRHYNPGLKNGSSSTTTGVASSSGGGHATTTAESNTSGDHEMFMTSSASASPGSDAFKPKIKSPLKPAPEKPGKVNRFKRSNKQRSSMTASLLSTHTSDSQYESGHRKHKKRTVGQKYTINNLLFSKINGAGRSSPVVELQEMVIKQGGAISTSSLAEDTVSSIGSSPPSSYDNSPTSRPNNCNKKTTVEAADVVETVCLIDKSAEPTKCDRDLPPNVNNFSSFGRNASKNNHYGQIKTSQLQTVRARIDSVNPNQDDSLNAEDCSLGYYYWDVTDWANGVNTVNPGSEVLINKSINLSTNSPYSPIYSKVFKVSSNKDKLETFEDVMKDLKEPAPSASNYDELYQENEPSSKLDLIKLRRNYMYLVGNREEEDQKAVECETAT